MPLILESGDRRVIRRRPTTRIMSGATAPSSRCCSASPSRRSARQRQVAGNSVLPRSGQQDSRGRQGKQPGSLRLLRARLGTGASPPTPPDPPPASSNRSVRSRFRSRSSRSPSDYRSVTSARRRRQGRDGSAVPRRPAGYQAQQSRTNELQNMEVARQVGSQMQVVAQVGRASPEGQTGDSRRSSPTRQDLPPFSPASTRYGRSARAKDANGNTVGPETTWSTSREPGDGHVRRQAADASPLAASDHPFSRVGTNIGHGRPCCRWSAR